MARMIHTKSESLVSICMDGIDDEGGSDSIIDHQSDNSTRGGWALVLECVQYS